VNSCSHCGRENDDSRITCLECGTPLPANAGLTAPIPGRQRFRFKLGAAFLLTTLILLLVLFLNVTSSRQFDGLQIRGTTRFKEQVVSALILLRDKSPQAYGIVTGYVGVIKQSKRSGMWSDRVPPTFELADPTSFYSLTWCAGAIAHDSFHSKMFHDHRNSHEGTTPPDARNLQVDEEKRCLAHQVQVLREIGAPREEITWCAEQDGTHADVNKDGKYDWDDYRKGDW